MKKLFMLGALSLFVVAAKAGVVTTTTTITIYGRNMGTTTTGSTVTINCDQLWNWECYTKTTTTTTESNRPIRQGENIIVTVFDDRGENPEVVLNGDFDWLEETEQDGNLVTTIAIR